MEQLSLEHSELRYRRLFEAAQDGILIVDPDTGAIQDVNPYMIQMMGYSREEFLEKKVWEVSSIIDMEASRSAFEILQQNEFIRYDKIPLQAKDGQLIQVEYVCNVYPEGGQKIIQCNVRNITERILVQEALARSEAALREQSIRDYLTGLFNRRYMEETLQREIYHAARKELSLGVIMLDVDHFKRFNDIHGHAAGDAILREVGHLLFENVRADDIPSRFGGDEFIILLPDASRAITQERAELISKKAAKLSIPFERQRLKDVTISFGVAVFPEDGSTSAAIIKAADYRLYRAKRV